MMFDAIPQKGWSNIFQNGLLDRSLKLDIWLDLLS